MNILGNLQMRVSTVSKEDTAVSGLQSPVNHDIVDDCAEDSFPRERSSQLDARR